jgi:peptidoglycan-associated lipoprotein
VESTDEDRLSRFDEEADILSKTLEDLNAQSPLTDIQFEYDSAALTSQARATLESHAQWLRRYSSIVVLVEGHCDERGTVEYNLALGERRAMAAYSYLQSLGVAADRLKTISYGKEFPLDPAHTEAAWSRNRRCHFVITSK